MWPCWNFYARLVLGSLKHRELFAVSHRRKHLAFFDDRRLKLFFVCVGAPKSRAIVE